MLKRKSKFQKIYKIRFLGLVLLALVMIIALILISKGVLDNVLFYYGSTKLDLKCDVPVLKRADKIVLTTLIFSDDFSQLDKVNFQFVNKDKEVTSLTINSKEWIRLYYMPNQATQLKFLPRFYDTQDNTICGILKDLTYLTGIISDTVLIKAGHKYYIYPNKESLLIRFSNKQELTKQYSDFYLEDGTKIKLIDFQVIFPIVQDYVRDDKIYDEGFNIQVLNATTKSGYAGFWARILQGLGFRITHVSTLNYLFEQIPEEKSYYLYISSKLQGTYSEQVLRNMFKDTAYFSNHRPKGVMSTADVVLILVK